MAEDPNAIAYIERELVDESVRIVAVARSLRPAPQLVTGQLDNAAD